ncbi:MAG: hypothetical protein LBF12_03840 [Christensenellaceae bacterium]|nr:hypothetical protein [Christensenellaceae bacterium]
MIDKTTVLKLKEYLTEISISIDSYSASMHEKMRGSRGCFNKTVDAIKLLRNEHFDVHTTTVVNKNFINHIPAMVHFLSKIGVTSIAFIGLIPLDTGENELLDEVVQNKIKTILQNVRNDYPDIQINTKQLIANQISTCCAGEYVFGLDIKGDISNCLLTRPRGDNLISTDKFGFCPGSSYLTSKKMKVQKNDASS